MNTANGFISARYHDPLISNEQNTLYMPDRNKRTIEDEDVFEKLLTRNEHSIYLDSALILESFDENFDENYNTVFGNYEDMAISTEDIDLYH